MLQCVLLMHELLVNCMFASAWRGLAASPKNCIFDLRESVHLIVFLRKCPENPAFKQFTFSTTVTNIRFISPNWMKVLEVGCFSPLCCIVWFCLTYWIWKACWSLADLYLLWLVWLLIISFLLTQSASVWLLFLFMFCLFWIHYLQKLQCN